MNCCQAGLLHPLKAFFLINFPFNFPNKHLNSYKRTEIAKIPSSFFAKNSWETYLDFSFPLQKRIFIASSECCYFFYPSFIYLSVCDNSPKAYISRNISRKTVKRGGVKGDGGLQNSCWKQYRKCVFEDLLFSVKL